MGALRSIDFKEIESQAQLSGDYSKVLERIEPLAKLGNPEAQCYFASIYHLGLGISPDALTAIKWYQLSAEQGYALASHNLSSLYFTGVENFVANPELGEHWHQISISQGFPS
jgi:TPR repeat protein